MAVPWDGIDNVPCLCIRTSSVGDESSSYKLLGFDRPFDMGDLQTSIKEYQLTKKGTIIDTVVHKFVLWLLLQFYLPYTLSSSTSSGSSHESASKAAATDSIPRDVDKR